MATIGDAVKAKMAREVDPVVSEVAVFKQLIKERKEPLELIRELLSNAGALEVGATKIEISYTQDKEGHVFEVADDGCGMNYTGSAEFPGRLDRFIGLGLSGIIGHKTDEFSWKGLGSKLSFQSRRVEIETCAGGTHPMYDVRINEPWNTLQNNAVPKPRISEHTPEKSGTKVRVIGHPPHVKQAAPFTFDQMKTYLLHRTFAGYTRERANAPEIWLSVLGRTEQLPFGFPEFCGIDLKEVAHEGVRLDEAAKTLFIHVTPKSHNAMRVTLKGFVTWAPDRFKLDKENLNTGLLLSVRGIPYFKLNMEEYGSTIIRTARPGELGTCLVIECDSIQDEMNISRSALVDSSKTIELRQIVTELFKRVETAEPYLAFRRIPERDKLEAQGGVLAEEKHKIERPDQNWVVLERANNDLVVLMREPQNESEVNALIWKLEALNALPFACFNSLAYIGAAKGPDLLCNFQEEKASEMQRATVVEVENNFYNYKAHGHAPVQYPKVICWDVPTSGRKAKIAKVPNKPYKFTLSSDEYQVHVYALRYMENIKVMSRDELKKRGVNV